MKLFAISYSLLGTLGYLDRSQTYGHPINIALRVMCFVSSFFILIPAMWHMAFETDTFVMRTATVMPLIIGLTNTMLYCAMLWQRPDIMSTIEQLERCIKESMALIILANCIFVAPISRIYICRGTDDNVRDIRRST